jgi:guanine deaminase
MHATPQRRLVIRNAAVPEAGARRLSRLDILIERGAIREIAAPGLVVGDDPAVLDAGDRIVIPGLVNCHTHSHFAWGRGFGDAWTLELHQNSGGGIWFGATVEDLRLGAMLVAADMIRNGCTAAYDMVLQAPVPSAEGMAAVAEGYAAIGLRAVVAAVVADRTFWESIPGLTDALDPEAAAFVRSVAAPAAAGSLHGLEEVLRTWRFDRDRIRPAVAPTVPLLCSDEFLRDVTRLARRYGAPLQTHLAESKGQALASEHRWGGSLTSHLDASGFLGPDVSVAHAVWVHGDDILRLADRGVGVAHNPGSNLRLGNGVAPVHAMRCAGVTVGIGTDACSCGDHQNMFEAARLASYLSRIGSPEPADWLAAPQTLEMASAKGAEILGFPNTGRIAVGQRADLVFLDRADLAYVPMNDPLAQILFSESGRAVRSVMIDGELVYDEGRFTRIDLAALLRQAEATAARLSEAAIERRRRLRALEPVVSQFCVGMTRRPHAVSRTLAPATPGKHRSCATS